MSGFDPVATQDVIVSHAKRLGVFDRVHAHEPKSAPLSGFSCAIWVNHIAPIQAGGLDSTSIRVAYSARIYGNMTKEPQDGIDREILAAVAKLMAAYSGDFTLAGGARNIDLLGAYGDQLSAQAGYLNQDNRLFRVMTITIPIIFNDVFAQEAA
jgi:hypothetical protein